jgi:hypothetical protein
MDVNGWDGVTRVNRLLITPYAGMQRSVGRASFNCLRRIVTHILLMTACSMMTVKSCVFFRVWSNYAISSVAGLYGLNQG